MCRVASSSSRRSSRVHIEIGENGQRKRKIARFPCDRLPISIGGEGRHHRIAQAICLRLRPALAWDGPAGVWGRRTLKLGKTLGAAVMVQGLAGLTIVYCSALASTGAVVIIRVVFPPTSSVFCWCRALKLRSPPLRCFP